MGKLNRAQNAQFWGLGPWGSPGSAPGFKLAPRPTVGVFGHTVV